MNIELMSPAGGINNFFACIKAHCDSIYLGLKKFNARRPAENFTIRQLKKIVPYAHSAGIKVYVTLNIDLKSNELNEAAGILKLLEDIEIDAVIIKDFGLIYLINKFFKKLSIHISTQNAVTASKGVLFAKRMQAKRVVMARELTFDELLEVSSIDGIETEIFTEGSMCFSVSGRCLMSSWVGARSGNRGVCTAPCRVIWQSKGRTERYFAMKDLTLIKHISKLKKTNIKALKIEGRLKNAGWVYTITSIYKKALENPDDNAIISKLSEELKKYSAREKKDGHITDHKNLTGINEEWENYVKAEDEKFMPLNFTDNNKIIISLTNDAIKISILIFNQTINCFFKIPAKPKKAKQVSLLNLKDLLNDNSILKEYSFTVETNDIGSLFLGSSFIQNIYDDLMRKINSIIKSAETLPKIDNEIIEFINKKNQNIKRNRLLGEYPDKIILSAAQDLSKFISIDKPVSTIVVYLDSQVNIDNLKALSQRYELILAIPDIMFEAKAKQTEILVHKLYKEGFNNFEANSYEGLEILSDLNCNKKAGIGLAVMNHLAADYLNSLGFNEVYASIEADSSIYKSISSFSKSKINCLVYGRLELFKTRVDSPFFIQGNIFEDKYVKMECSKNDEVTNFVSIKPLSFIGMDYKKENILFDHLTADLRYYTNPLKTLNDIYKIIKSDKSESFNFYRKLV
jgi:collagenase-like PrtC family protease